MIRMMHKLMSWMGLAAVAAVTPHASVEATWMRRDTSLPRQARKRSGHYGKMRIFRSYAARG